MGTIGIITGPLLLVVAFAWAAPRIRRWLLGWYIREVKQVEVAEAPGEAIVTYPLA